VRLFVFDEALTDDWIPFALSRPAAELRFGALLQRERLERFAGKPARGLVTRSWLSSFDEPGAPPVTSVEGIDASEDRLLLSSRWVPDLETRLDRPGGATVFRAGEAVVGAYLPAGAETPDEGWTGTPEALPTVEIREVGGSVLESVTDLVGRGVEQLARDLASLAPVERGRGHRDLPVGVSARGSSLVCLGEGAELEPGVHLDTRRGGIWLDRNVEVRSGCRLEGPLYAGPGSRLLGGPMAAVSAGPVSHLRGELAKVTVVGHSNKAHAGFLGHACVGRWVNLGAGTTNSDLKNNYGPVRRGDPSGPVDTGLTKFGCLLGDHVKTAIGTLLPTGAVVGTGANVFGAVRAPRWVPPFAWGAEAKTRYRREDFVEVARTVMKRRDVPWSEGTRSWLEAVWDAAYEATDTGGE
jgi:UDP-N-acetylglucosamine diphosphorylase/glucosamine-1-phosphate N-acetyltransferase